MHWGKKGPYINPKMGQPISENGLVLKKTDLELKHGQVEHGMKVLYLKLNLFFTGYFRNDKAEGKGKFIHAGGDVYEGDWKNNKANGYGKFT